MDNPNRCSSSTTQDQRPHPTNGVIGRVALFARVFTVRDQNPEMQLHELREYASRRGWTVAGEFVDHGVSDLKDTRPQLNKLMAAPSVRF